jgi:hypothetical protein
MKRRVKLGCWSPDRQAIPETRSSCGCCGSGRLFRERYEGFTAKHFHEHLVQSHSFRWGYSWTKTYLQNRGYIQKAPPASRCLE